MGTLSLIGKKGKTQKNPGACHNLLYLQYSTSSLLINGQDHVSTLQRREIWLLAVLGGCLYQPRGQMGVQ